MLEVFKRTLEALKEDKILIFLSFLPFLLMIIIFYALKMDLPSKGLSSLRPLLPPFMGTEIFVGNLQIDEWSSYVKYKEWKNLVAQIFFLFSIIYYFFIYSFYSKSKLGGNLAVLHSPLLALLFVFLYNYLSLLRIVIVTSLAIVFLFVIPLATSGLGFVESFQQSFKIVKENLMEILLLFLLSVGINNISFLFMTEISALILGLFRLSFTQQAVALYVLNALAQAIIIAFQISLFTNYLILKFAKKENTGLR
jgi:hypothetical protein